MLLIYVSMLACKKLLRVPLSANSSVTRLSKSSSFNYMNHSDS